MKIKRSCLCWLLVFLLTLSSAFSALADIGGGELVESDEALFEAEAYAFDAPMLYEVNSDLSDYILLPTYYISTKDLYPTNWCANSVANLSGANGVSYLTNPYAYQGDIEFAEFIWVLTFSEPYDRSKIYLNSSNRIYGLTLVDGIETSSLTIVDGISYIDDYTLKISSTTDLRNSSSIEHFVTEPRVLVPAASVPKGSSFTCQIYTKLEYRPKTTVIGDSGGTGEGGGAGGGSGSGGAAT